MKQKKDKSKRKNMGLIEEATLSRRPAALPTDDDSSHENVRKNITLILIKKRIDIRAAHESLPLIVFVVRSALMR